MPAPLFDHPFAAVLADMDGTILTSVTAAERAWSRWARSHDIAPASFLSRIHGVQATDTIRSFGRADLDPAREAALLTQMEIEDVDGVESIPGAIAFLDTVPRGRWALVTSAPRALAIRRMEAAGFPLPEVMVTAEEVTRGKPAPDGFLLAAARLGVAAKDCLVFEDSAAGIASAEAAGGTVVVVTAMHQQPFPTTHVAIASFDGLTASVQPDGRLRV